jgi:hypothetical protein
VRPARLVSHPSRCPTTETAERELRAALRRRLFDGFERGRGFPTAWELAWADCADRRAQLRSRASALRTGEEDYRELLALDWQRWRAS